MKLAGTVSAFALALALIIALPVHAQTPCSAAGTVHFTGTDGDWFNPANWSSGCVPDVDDDVVLDDFDSVMIDPDLGPMPVQVRDLIVRDAARLETLPGSHLITRDELVNDNGEVVHRSSASEGELLIIGAPSEPVAGWGYATSTVRLNPTPKSRRDVILKTSATVEFGLGGLAPASIVTTSTGTVVNAGAGHYATLTADLVVLSGNPGAPAQARRLGPGLLLALHYGFEPIDGDSFQIVTVNRRLVDQFRDLPEGALVGCTVDDVGIYITYAGGNGNDVVLIAADTSRRACQLPDVQRVRAAARAE
jgi:hypothetical protein